MATTTPKAYPEHLPSVLMVGAGEYNTGYVPTAAGAAADKRAGVTALVLFDLRRRGRVGRILLCDALGTRLPAARACMQEKIGDVYKGMDLTLECFPADDVAWDDQAHIKAMDTMRKGDSVIVFTPDPTHGPIAAAAIARGLHVLVAKPLVKTVAEHLDLTRRAKEAGVILATEYHKRFDAIYNDARERMRGLGPFSYFYSHMTQRREQLDTFKAWAGKSSDISFYLNSHHIDVHAWAMQGRSRPVRVVSAASFGVANARLEREGVEDTISLLVTWENVGADGGAGTTGHAVYMASWAAPTADCHTQQGFHYMAHKGEMRVDQAHRGYSLSADSGAGGGTGALATLNPLYMRYTPDSAGFFAGQTGYGYRSIEVFVETAACVARGEMTAADVDAAGVLATATSTYAVTAILEAGRRSLDAGGKPVDIAYESADSFVPSGFK
jgi:D-galacturonate reductase